MGVSSTPSGQYLYSRLNCSVLLISLLIEFAKHCRQMRRKITMRRGMDKVKTACLNLGFLILMSISIGNFKFHHNLSTSFCLAVVSSRNNIYQYVLSDVEASSQKTKINLTTVLLLGLEVLQKGQFCFPNALGNMSSNWCSTL